MIVFFNDTREGFSLKFIRAITFLKKIKINSFFFNFLERTHFSFCVRQKRRKKDKNTLKKYSKYNSNTTQK